MYIQYSSNQNVIVSELRSLLAAMIQTQTFQMYVSYFQMPHKLQMSFPTRRFDGHLYYIIVEKFTA